MASASSEVAQYRLDVREEGVVLGQVGAHRFDDVADFPDEDAGVPEKFAALQERLRQLQVGVFSVKHLTLLMVRSSDTWI